jgi:hypothetical protein
MFNEKTFRRWKWELTRPEAARPVSWCPVQAKARTGEKAEGMRLIIDGRITFEVETGFDRQLLQDVLAVICG